MSQQHKTQDTIFLVGGALLGAAAMYLLDPEVGDRRRRRLAQAAESAYGGARHAVTDQLGRVSGEVKSLAHRLTDQAAHLHDSASAYPHDLADQAKHLAAELRDRAAGYLNAGEKSAASYGAQAGAWGTRWLGHAKDAHDDLADQASNWRSWANRRAAKAASRGRSWLGQFEPQEHSAAPALASGAVGIGAVGLAALYFFNPRYGKQRRNWVMDQVEGCMKATSRIMRSTGSDIAHRLRGAARHTRDVAGQYVGGREWVDSQELISRIRDEVRRFTAFAEQIQFMADSDGTVTATGSVQADESHGLLELLHRIPGVRHVINRLEIREAAHNATTQPSEPASAAQ